MTLEPFRFYVYPQPTRLYPSALSSPGMARLGINARNGRWAVSLLENTVPHDEKEKAEQWERLKKLFLEIRSEIISSG